MSDIAALLAQLQSTTGLQLGHRQRRLLERVVAAQPGDKLFLVFTHESELAFQMGHGITTTLLVALALREDSCVVVSPSGRDAANRGRKLVREFLMPLKRSLASFSPEEVHLMDPKRSVSFVYATPDPFNNLRGMGMGRGIGLWLYMDAEAYAVPLPQVRAALVAWPEAIQIATAAYRGALPDARRTALEQDGWTIVDMKDICKS